MMPTDIRPSNEYLEPSRNMGFGLELKKSSKQQQNSKIVKERVPSSQAHQSLKYQGKTKEKNCVGPPYTDVPHKPREDVPHKRRECADDGIFIQPKSSGNCQQQLFKGKAGRDNELVKNMSNLPGYLQRVERGENHQEKVLNVGVLDWSRLEKWKHNQKCIPERGANNASSTSSSLSLKTTIKSSTFSSAVHNETLAHQRDQHPSHFSSLNSSCKDGHSPGVKPSTLKVIRFQDIETASKSTLDGQKKIPWTYKSFGRNSSDVVLEKGKRKDLDQKNTSEMGNLASNLRNHGTLLSLKEDASAWDGEAKKRIEERHKQKITSDMGAKSSLLRSRSSKEKMSARSGETKKRAEEFHESDIDLGHQHGPGEHKNIVLLLPRKHSKNSSLELPRTLLDENLTEANLRSFSGSFSPQEVHSSEFFSEILHSSQLPSRDETATGPDGIVHCLTNAKSAEGKDVGQNSIMPTNPNVIETMKVLDQETAELEAKEGRNPTPNRRFSFSLGRMSRSFSFKDGLALPQLSSKYASVKSGPVRSEASPSLDDSNREKEGGHNRRSSPLRRMLDPLLRSKGLNPLHSTETVQPLKGSFNSSIVRPGIATESLHNEKHGELVVQAHLHHTIKNGLPLFRFEINNSSSILAATMKNLASSGKYNSGQNYTFYSVNEIKKKSGSWISQGNKGKSCGYVYNVIGQMRISSSHFLDLTGKNSDNQYIVREAVLFGVDLRQADQSSPKFKPNKELAAVVVKMPSENLSHIAQRSDKDGDTVERGFTECFSGDECSCQFRENKDFSSITVILPGGVHSLPKKGVPSPLIDRWKSGGSCDCGGWDVGCKLRVFANHNQSCSIQTAPKAFLNSDRFELFVQGGTQQKRPMFSLAKLKQGNYSIEFNSSISSLQAFSICVTFISCQKSSDLSEVSDLSEAKAFQEPTQNVDDKIEKTATIVPSGGHPKYAPNPPLSPVGRV